jgi:protein-L-isoaspartate(D-aspartate) O-methyltransferase
MNDMTDWHEVSFWTTTWQEAEHVGVRDLGSLLADLTEQEMIYSWWFLRKSARWKIRYLPAGDHVRTKIAAVLNDLAAHGKITRWVSTVYEPEVHAFGGPDGMAVAHDLFHADSRRALNHLRSGGGHERELGLLLIVEMMRAAGLDWYEQGHVWRLVTEERTVPRPSARETDVTPVRRFLTADTGRTRERLGVSDWFDAFREAGQRHAALNDEGVSSRGLRAILAHHVLFAWNRLGLPEQVQGALAATAAQVVFNADTTPPGSVTVGQVTDPVALRHALVERIRSRGTFRTRVVETAFAAVPREIFLPEVDTETAYQPRVVVTKTAADGTAISSASDPNLVATQAEDLDVHPGHTVLEIGAATGINAALLAELAGPSGRVVTIEIDEDLADRARHALSKAGYPEVKVICGDGAAGYGEAAPYDRIIVTAGAWDISAAWWNQLTAEAGRLVVPLRLHGSGLTRSIAFDLGPSGIMTGVHIRVCGFVPLRGSAAHTGASITLTDGVSLNLDTSDDSDESALAQVFTHPAHEEWTGLYVGDHEPVGHLDLWLATETGIPFARLSVSPKARRAGLVVPALRWAGACLYDGGTLAYLALREHSRGSEELGVVAHGPDAEHLAVRTVEVLQEWNHARPAHPTITAYPAGTSDQELRSGTRVERPDTRLTITW